MKSFRALPGLRASLAAALGVTSACGGSTVPTVAAAPDGSVPDAGGHATPAPSTPGPSHFACVDPVPIPEVASLPPLVRSRLAEHWTEAARMEHASIGAFARFVLQLMALGAPPDLVVDAQRAMEDETRHARLAFGMGSAYAGADIGPGRLAADGCLDTMDLRSILEHLADRDPAVAAVLATLAADEARHAELAWRSVAWMLTAFGHAARDALQEALREALTEARRPAGRSDADGSLLEYGVLTEGERATLQGEALRAVVLPLARALLGGREEDRDPDPDPDPDPRGRGQRGRGSVPTSPRGTLPLPCRHGAITPCVPS